MGPHLVLRHLIGIQKAVGSSQGEEQRPQNVKISRLGETWTGDVVLFRSLFLLLEFLRLLE